MRTPIEFPVLFSLTLAGVCAGLLFARPVAAQDDEPEQNTTDEWRTLDPTVVTATPIPQARSTLGSSVTVLSAEELEAQGITDVRDALDVVAGAYVAQNGSQGSLGSLFLRGGNSDFTLVMIDGVPINDVGGGVNLGTLTVDNIAQIEVLRGAQSALYGADAMSGVINIITKKGEGPPTWNYDVAAGNRDVFRATGSVSGGTETGHYSASLSHRQTSNRDGITHDWFRQHTASLRAGTWLGDDVEIDGTVHYDKHEIDNPGDTAVNPVDIDDETVERRLVASLSATHHISDTWQHRVKIGVFNRELDNTDDSAQHFNDFVTDTRTTVKRYTLDYRHTVTVLDDHLVTVGGELEEEDGEFEVVPPGFAFATSRRILNRSVYAQLQSAFLDDTLHVQAGVRVDNNSGYGKETSPRVAVSYLNRPTQTRVHGSWGEGIKNPDIFELASPFGSNPNLSPEEVEHWDVGVEQTVWDERATVDVTYFEQKVEDLIVGQGFALPPINLSRSKTHGLEVTARVQPRDDLLADLTYTFLGTEDKATGQDLLRRPKHSAYGRITYQPGPWHATVSARYGGKTRDMNFNPFPAVRVINDDYVRVNVGGGYHVNDHLELYALVENVLDDHYETAFGFESNGTTATFGARGSF